MANVNLNDSFSGDQDRAGSVSLMNPFLQAVLQPEPVLQMLEVDPVSRRRILIADDDEDLTDILDRRLKKAGFDTLVANSGSEARNLLASQVIDLIILDLQLPDESGLQLCQGMVDEPKTANIPVIIVSGHPDDDIVRQTRSAGARYFIRKPYDPNVLLTIIECCLTEDDNSAW